MIDLKGIKLPACILHIKESEDIKKLLLQYSKHLGLNYEDYEKMYLLANMKINFCSCFNVDGDISERKKNYLNYKHRLDCGYFRKYLKVPEYCYICNAGADCNKYKIEEEFVIAYLLQDIKKGSMEIWHQLNGVITKNTFAFVAMYEYRKGPPFSLFGFLADLILLNMAPSNINPNCFLSAKESIFDNLPGYIKKELQIQLDTLNTRDLPEKKFGEYIEENNLLPRLIKNSKIVYEKVESIKKSGFNPGGSIPKNNNKQLNKQLPKEFFKDNCPTSIENMEVEIQGQGYNNPDISNHISSEEDEQIKKDMKTEQTIVTQTKHKNVNRNSNASACDIDTSKNVDKKQEEKTKTISLRNENPTINKVDNNSKPETKLESEIKNNTREQKEDFGYFATDTENIKPLDCLKITDFHQFVHTYFAQRLGIVVKGTRLEFIPETRELLSYSKNTDEPVVYTFEDIEFRTMFGMQIVESKGYKTITFNSIPLVGYFDNCGHYFDRRRFYDFQLGYTMVNFPKDRNKILTLEDTGILAKDNDFKDYRGKVFACIKNYHDLYDKFMEYWDMRELQFRKKYKDEIGLRYLAGRSSELEISTGRGKERVVRNARGFNYDWLLDPEELENRKDILPNKMLLVGTFRNLEEYVDGFVTEDTTTTPLGYPVEVSDKYTLDELKEDICKEAVRSVLIKIARSWKNERSSLRLLYFDHKKIILMADNDVPGKGLAFDTLYYGMGHRLKELLPGIVPKNRILTING